jgi:probable addiction module antidote protein
MAKTKTSAKRGFSFEKMPEIRLKKNAKVLKREASKVFHDSKQVSEALIQALREGDADAFKEILAAYLSVTNKDKFAAKADIPRRTLFRMLSPEGNPTLDNIARIVRALSKAT